MNERGLAVSETVAPLGDYLEHLLKGRDAAKVRLVIE